VVFVAEEVVRVEDEQGVRTVTFCRPHAANAFDEALYRAVAGALVSAADDDEVAVVVLTGEGRTFCAGTDLVEMAALVGGLADDSADDLADGADDDAHGFMALLDILSAFPKPLLAAVNGPGVGLGFTMLAHCDIVVMSERARLMAPFASMGVPPEAASSYLLPRRMGRQAAAHALFTSEWISADDAVACGLAWRVCAAESLLDETLALARRIASMSLPSLLATKRLLLDAEAEGVRRARSLEDAAFADLLRRKGAQQAVLGQLDQDE
jgi:enoyl-CoA hydratase/carnithine racemase